MTILVALSLPGKIPFPRNTDWSPETPFEWRLDGKTQHFVLPRPLGGQVDQPSGSYAMRQSAFDGRFDKIGRREGERDRHVAFRGTATFPFGDGLRAYGMLAIQRSVSL